MIANLLSVLFGGGRNAIAETVEVFRPNAEADAIRDAAQAASALSQFAAEFGVARRSWFDVFIDGLNRLPRPFLALGTLGLFVAAMVDPIWFAARMQGIALVPEPLWWLMGAIVSFYFGARHQAKSQEFQRGIAETLARTQGIVGNIRKLDALSTDSEPVGSGTEAPVQMPAFPDNAALEDWRLSRGT